VDLLGQDGSGVDSVLTQPKRVALLAYLCAARPRGFHRRDKLLSLFWPESDHNRARSSLRSSIHFLRDALGHELLVSRGDEEVGLDWDRIWCDVTALQEKADLQLWADVLDLHRGDLLEGFHIQGCPGFEDWLAEERERLREIAAGAAWSQAHQYIERGELTEAERAGQRALSLVFTDENEVREFIWALAGAGERASAVRFYEKFASRLLDELELEPSAETREVAEAIKAGEASSQDLESQVLVPSSLSPGTVPPERAAIGDPVGAGSGSGGRRRWLWGVGAVVFAAFALAIQSQFFEAGIPVVSITVLPAHLERDSEGEVDVAERVRGELLYRLTGAQRLQVVSRVPLVSLRNPQPSVTEIAQELAVDFLVQPAVRLAGDTLGVRLVLFDGRDGREVETQDFRTPLYGPQLSAFGDDFAQWISLALSRPFPPEGRLAELPEPRREAELLLSDAAVLKTMAGVQAQRRVIDLLRQAVRLDPGFGEAWGELARRLIQVGGPDSDGNLAFRLILQDDPDAAAEGEAALLNAERLAPGSFQTLMARASWEMWMEWDYQAARSVLAEAHALRPNDSDLLSWIADVERHLGNWEAAIAAHRQALEQVPFSAKDLRYAELTFFLVGDLATSVDLLEQALRLHPTQDGARFLALREHMLLGDLDRLRARIQELAPTLPRPTAAALWDYVSYLESDYASRLEWLRRAPGNFDEKGIYCHLLNDLDCRVAYGDSLITQIRERSIPGEGSSLGYGMRNRASAQSVLAVAHALKGNEEEAIRLSDEAMAAIPVSRDAIEGPRLLRDRVRVCLFLGDDDGALDALEELLKVPSQLNTRIFHSYPSYDQIRDHPRFQSFLEKYADGPLKLDDLPVRPEPDEPSLGP
jgi:DNA-binding SARP family transcriptional activator/TolB-like protein